MVQLTNRIVQDRAKKAETALHIYKRYAREGVGAMPTQYVRDIVNYIEVLEQEIIQTNEQRERTQ